jgi:hypothetical protein
MGNSRVEICKKFKPLKAAIIKLFAINHEV